jgi:hypothetical protein
VRVVARTVALVACVGVVSAAAAEPPDRPTALLLALDGMPYRVVEQARAEGAFAGWSDPSRLISTFPSTTHVAFASLFQPLGVRPSDGYELRYFDRDKNRMTGGSPIGYQQQAYDWKGMLHVKRQSLFAKLMVYTSPRITAGRELKTIRKAVLASDRELILAHVGSTDAMGHLRGDEAMLRFLHRLDAQLAQLHEEYERIHGRPLRVLLYSDHGNTAEKVDKVKGLRKELRAAGFRVTKKLRRDNDVVAPTFGIVSYGPLFTYAEKAESAAVASVGHEAVDLAFWLGAERRIEVVSDEGRASIRWRDVGGRRRVRYEHSGFDVLRVDAARYGLVRDGLLDEQGYADAEDWFRETAFGYYPDPLNRLINAFAGGRVASPATVLLSLQPGYGWGWRSAHFMARVQGGRVEGTHGGLDSESSVGFWMTDDSRIHPPAAQTAARALAAFADDYHRDATAHVLPGAD